MSIARHVVILMAIFLALSFIHIEGLELSNYESGRFLTESDISVSSQRLYHDTLRVDPLNNLKKYKGGYDIRNKHYWSSTTFTGIYGYAIAVIWLICGIVFLVIATTCNKSSTKQFKNRPSFCLKESFQQPIILSTILFTFLSVIACILILGGDYEFHLRAKKVTYVILHAAENATRTIHNTTGAMKGMDKYLTNVVNVSPQAIQFLNSTSKRLNSQADIIETQANKNKHLIYDGLNLLYILTTVTISLILAFVIALPAFNILKYHRTLQVLLAVCWVFTAVSWIFFGAYFFIHNFVGDTCLAIKGFQIDPHNNSFSQILPCDELLRAKPILTEVSAGIHELVDKVNWNISASYGDVVQICNPFSPPPMYDYQPWECSPSSTHIGEVPRVLRQLACPDSTVTCNGGIVIPASYYNAVDPYCTSIQKLVDAFPNMENLVHCQPVKDAFYEILDKHCTPMRTYLRVVWTSMLFLSLALVVLILIWVLGAYQGQNCHPLSACESS